ncbi:MAG: peptidoglycan-binding domain-containing protein, partial [Rubripirellula sp.]
MGLQKCATDRKLLGDSKMRFRLQVAMLFFCVCTVFLVSPSAAQERENEVFIQISSHATVKQAVRAAVRYLEDFPDLAVYSTSSGFFALVVATVPTEAGQIALDQLKANSLVPVDSVVTPGLGYIRREWWNTEPYRATSPTVIAAITSERGWDRATRSGVQNALLWSGDYATRVDGDIGPSSRKAIKSFQIRNGFAPTGYLTNEQITKLERIRVSRVSTTGFEKIADIQSGMKIGLPTRYFPEYMAKIDDSGLFKSYDHPVGVTSGILTLLSHELGAGQMQDLFDVISGFDNIPANAYR